MNPDVEENQALSSVRNSFNEHSVEIIKEDVWGLRTLAYPISRYEQGRYIVIQFSVEDTSLVDALNQELRINESILRYTIQVN